MKTILITGSNRGIGFEIARQCAAKSFRVFLSGRNKEKLDEALQKLQQEKLQAEILVMDTSDPKSISQAAAQFRTLNIPLDVLVNNAGIGVRGDQMLSSGREEIFTQTLVTNAYGPLRVTKDFLPFIPS